MAREPLFAGALIGTTTLIDQVASYETLLMVLCEFGTQSRHPELANIPIFLLLGTQWGGCTAYGFSRAQGACVAGFMTMKGAADGAQLAADGPEEPLLEVLAEAMCESMNLPGECL